MHHVENTVPEISFTEAAVKHLVSYLQKNSEYTGIRLSVKKQDVPAYLMSLIMCDRLMRAIWFSL